MKNTLFNYGRLFWVIPLILSCLVFTTKSYSEEANLKINILNLDKPGVLYLSICKDAAGFEETVENESEEASCITSAGEIELQNFEINGMIPHGEYAISLFVDSNGNQTFPKTQRQNDFIVFPSFILHQAVPFESDENRAIIAGNITLKTYEQIEHEWTRVSNFTKLDNDTSVYQAQTLRTKIYDTKRKFPKYK